MFAPIAEKFAANLKTVLRDEDHVPDVDLLYGGTAITKIPKSNRPSSRRKIHNVRVFAWRNETTIKLALGERLIAVEIDLPLLRRKN